MTATAQAIRHPEQQTGTWSNIFPAEQVTEQQSALFVKKLLAVAVSNIAYIRAIFPEPAFADRCLEDLNLKILRDDSGCPAACQLIKWVKGCFDALDKKYLRMMTVGIYTDPDDPETVIESYCFKFTYNSKGGVEMDCNNQKINDYNTAATKKATIRLLHTIVILTQSLHNLPDNVMMTMKLLYYDDVTPEDYEPPGFRAGESEHFVFEEEPVNIKVGDVSTPFHTVKLRIKTDSRQFNMDEAEKGEEEQEEIEEEAEQMEEVEEEVKSENDTESRVSHNSTPQTVPEPIEADSVPDSTPAQPGVDDQAVDITVSQSQVSTTQDDKGVRCGCGCNEDDGLMVLCAVCKYWQHGVCYTVLHEDEAPSNHICQLCSKPADPDNAGTDPSLNGKSELAVQATCLWRRALSACKDLNRVLAPLMSKRLGVETAVAQGLVNRLEKEGFIKAPTKSKRLGKVIDKSKVEEGIKRYFKRKSQESKESGDEKESSVDMQIDKLTQKTEQITLTGKSLPQKQQNGDQESQVSEDRPRGRKRVKSVEEGHQFDVSESQDTQEMSRKKKRKSSVARKPVRV